MTRMTDVDVYAPERLGSRRVQGASKSGIQRGPDARRIHVNNFINSGPTARRYYSKARRRAAARFISRRWPRRWGPRTTASSEPPVRDVRFPTCRPFWLKPRSCQIPTTPRLLDSPAWREKVAQAITDGIDRYAQQYPVSGSAPQ